MTYLLPLHGIADSHDRGWRLKCILLSAGCLFDAEGNGYLLLLQKLYRSAWWRETAFSGEIVTEKGGNLCNHLSRSDDNRGQSAQH